MGRSVRPPAGVPALPVGEKPTGSGPRPQVCDVIAVVVLLSACAFVVACWLQAKWGCMPTVECTGTLRSVDGAERRNSVADRRTDVAPCGNYCAGCPDYLAPVRDDDPRRRRAAAAIEKGTDTAVLLDQVRCEGCWGTVHHPSSASFTCRIRQCVSSGGFATCADCRDFPCNLYLRQYAEDSDQARNIRAIKAQGVDTWLAGRRQNPQSTARGTAR